MPNLFVLSVVFAIAAVVVVNGAVKASPSPKSNTTADCFPADATVALQDGSVKRMDELRVGDSVRVSSGVYSKVFLFTHADPHAKRSFVKLTTDTGHALELTSGHYLPVNNNYNNKLVAASEVAVGDALTLTNGNTAYVVQVATAVKVGLYNPQTMHGNIAVNDIVASTFTIASDPAIAHALLSPLRTGYAKFKCTIKWRHDAAVFMAKLLGTAGKAVAA